MALTGGYGKRGTIVRAIIGRASRELDAKNPNAAAVNYCRADVQFADGTWDMCPECATQSYGQCASCQHIEHALEQAFPRPQMARIERCLECEEGSYCPEHAAA